MLSATVADGVLSIVGTDGDDNISVKGAGDDLVVRVNDTESTFAAADVTAITIDAGAGDDRVKLRRVGIDATIDGGDGNDHLGGGRGNDVINGGAGNDKIFGASGDDQLSGGDGNDAVIGGSGDDVIDGGAGNDRLKGGRGNDTINGGADNDRVSGGHGDDNMLGGDGDDKLAGGRGNDNIDGGAGNDKIKGNRGEDVLNGGDDILVGNTEEDVIDGGEGDNVIGERDRREEPPTPQEIQAFVARRAAEIFEHLDKNEDGAVTEADFESQHFWDSLARRFDANEDGTITQQEVAGHLLSKAGRRLGPRDRRPGDRRPDGPPRD